MAFTPKLTYKGKPLVRKDNELYYGSYDRPICALSPDPDHDPCRAISRWQIRCI